MHEEDEVRGDGRVLDGSAQPGDEGQPDPAAGRPPLPGRLDQPGRLPRHAGEKAARAQRRVVRRRGYGARGRARRG